MTGFLGFAELCQKVESVSGSLEKIDLVAAFLSMLDEAELAIASNFIMGTVFAPSSDLVLGVGPSILYEALARACGCPNEQISEMLRATGDPGLVAAGVVEKRRPIGFAAFLGGETLSISDVYLRFQAVALASGKKSQDAKIKNLQFLFSQASPLEARYIARLAIEDMRIGIGEGGARDAIAKAFARSAEDVERGYNLTNDMGLVAVSARRGTLSELGVTLNHPIKMMLAQLSEGIPTALQELGTAAVEVEVQRGPRADSQRRSEGAHLHAPAGECDRLFAGDRLGSQDQYQVQSAILDGEAVAIGKDGRPVAFQQILKRFRRKYDVEKLAAEIPLRLFLFDLIYLGGKSVVDLPLTERRALLQKIADSSLLAEQVLSGDPREVEEIYRKALDAGHEGLMLKNPSSVYAPRKKRQELAEDQTGNGDPRLGGYRSEVGRGPESQFPWLLSSGLPGAGDRPDPGRGLGGHGPDR